MKRAILLSCLLFVFCQFSFSQSRGKDVVYLKNGSIIRGIVTEMVPNESLKIVTNDGSLFVYSMDEVDKVSKDQGIASSSSDAVVFQGGLFNPDAGIRGYRGFVGLGYTVGTGDWNVNRFEINTSHGYQFSPYFFLGGGAGVHIYHDSGDTGTAIPLFADARINFIQGPIVPSFGFKLGYSLDATDGLDGLGVYVAPSVSARFLLNNGMAFNIGLGYTVQMAELYYYSYYSHYYSENVNLGGITFKVDFEF